MGHRTDIKSSVCFQAGWAVEGESNGSRAVREGALLGVTLSCDLKDGKMWGKCFSSRNSMCKVPGVGEASGHWSNMEMSNRLQPQVEGEKLTEGPYDV